MNEPACSWSARRESRVNVASMHLWDRTGQPWPVGRCISPTSPGDDHITSHSSRMGLGACMDPAPRTLSWSRRPPGTRRHRQSPWWRGWQRPPARGQGPAQAAGLVLRMGPARHACMVRHRIRAHRRTSARTVLCIDGACDREVLLPSVEGDAFPVLDQALNSRRARGLEPLMGDSCVLRALLSFSLPYHISCSCQGMTIRGGNIPQSGYCRPIQEPSDYLDSIATV
jgi:hypothetical protein